MAKVPPFNPGTMAQRRIIELMDTTLRDGEQTSGVSFSAGEKLALAQALIEDLGMDRIEVASARVSAGEFEAVKQITSRAREKGYLNKVEVLTFVDGGQSIKWMEESGARVQNLLTKGSLNHLTHQLRKKPAVHFREIEASVRMAGDLGIDSNIYLEDWSNGMRQSREYVMDYLDVVTELPVKRIMLPDTLGVLTPGETGNYIADIVSRYPEMHFDFHGHNDYDLSVANVMEALKAGCHGLHLTVNGMGERAGNAPLASVVAIINDFMPEIEIRISESKLYKTSKLVSAFTGISIPANKPVVGDNVFTQTAGIHADGDNKKNLYFNDLLPERFGRKRQYALGKTSGKANIQKNLQELGITLSDDELQAVTKRIIELGDKKEKVTREDLPFIISDILDTKNIGNRVQVKSYVLTHSKGLKPTTSVAVEIDGKSFEANAQGDGQFDAFMNALKKVYTGQNLTLPELTDYAVRIPPGSHSDALCETIITWQQNGTEFKTRGLDSDQTVSAIKATEKMLNRMATD